MGLTSYIIELAKSHSKIKNLDLQLSSSRVYNIFVNEKGKNHLHGIALGGKI